MNELDGPRVVFWFSCGAASAVATKLTLEKYAGAEVLIAYVDTGSEHPDNMRFLKDCERWFGQEIEIHRSTEYADTWDVWNRTRYLVGPQGARCTAELKKKVRFGIQRADDIQVFGYTIEEQNRADRFRDQNFDVILECPLIDRGLTKGDCLALLLAAGIDLPEMYKLGYRNNNCIGCPKGGMGYWNKIRVDFPDVFARMARVERRLDVAINKRDGKRLFLDMLPEGVGRYEEEDIECSLMCAAVPASEIK